MNTNKKKWLLPLLALGELIVIFALTPANCGNDGARDEDRESSGSGGTCVLPRNTEVPWPDCNRDDDCPSDSSCLKGVCVVTGQKDNEDAESEEEYEEEWEDADAAVQLAFTRHCEDSWRDCGCGYDCLNGECRKVTHPYCCANAECGPGMICAWEGENPSAGECLPWQCDEHSQCENQCGTRCENHRCAKVFCCSDAECSDGKLCVFFGKEYIGKEYIQSSRGLCEVPECASDADCGCGKICDAKRHRCADYSPDRPIKCCGTDFYYYSGCVPHSRIENGRCIDDTHCPRGKTCEDGMCLPSTCADNANCGCEAVCRKGHCERGCDKDSDCCNQGEICDHSRCVDPNAPDEDW